MDFFDRAVSRFCYQHPRFGIRNLMIYVIAGTGLCYFIGLMDTTGTLYTFLAFSPRLIFTRGQVWRLFTFLFYPLNDNPFWLIISLYFYYFIGSSLEGQWGQARFTIYYGFGWLLNVIFGIIVYFTAGRPEYVFITADYLNLSLFFAFAAMWPDMTFLIMFIIPVKAKWMAYLDAAVFLAGILLKMNSFPMNLLPLVAMLNFLLFFGGTLIKRATRGRAYTARRVQFRAATRSAQRAHDRQPYRHKCSVCGRTDVSDPGLEFRYCSRCQGYHCFCIDHINNHVHFTE